MKVLFTMLAASLVTFSVASAGQAKVPLCHQTGAEDNAYVIIHVAEPAYDTHVAHGDFAPNEAGTCEDDGGPGGEN